MFPSRQSLKSRAIRFLLNRVPSYRRAGGEIVHVSSDLTYARVRIKYGWRTYGQKNSIFGGALYATIDPAYVIMLQWRLGRRYAVWDKAATIEFKRPARSTLHADISFSDAELQCLRAEVDANGRAERIFHVLLSDCAGVVHAEFMKHLVIKRRADRHDDDPPVV